MTEPYQLHCDPAFVPLEELEDELLLDELEEDVLPLSLEVPQLAMMFLT